MSVFVDKDSKVIIQGFTGQHATFHAEEAMNTGTNVVGGVTPGKGGATHLGLPVFNSVAEAVEETGADVSGIFVPPAVATDSLLEAVDAGVDVAVIIADGVPVQDMVRTKRYLAGTLDPHHRSQLPRHHHAGRVQGRHHAEPHLHEGPGRRGLALRHAELRGRLTDDGARVSVSRRASASAATRSTAPTSRPCSRRSRATTTPTWS